MTRDEFGWWLRGLVHGGVSNEPLVAQVMNAAREILKVAPAARAEPPLTPIKVSRFCAHNVALVEDCQACGAHAQIGCRIFSVALPETAEEIFIRKVPGGVIQ